MLTPDMYKNAYPSKTMAYLGQGRPAIAAIEEESDLVKTMQSEGDVYTAPIGNADSFAQLLWWLADDLSWKESMNQSALAAFEKYFASSVVLHKWSKLVSKSCRTS